MKIAYLGDRYSHSYAASLYLADKKSDFRGYKSVSDAAQAVMEGECDMCVLPSENSVEGAVTATEDILLEKPLYIRSRVALPIHHCFVTKGNVPFDVIETVYSHPQALAQCSLWLKTNVPQAKTVSVYSTSYALGLIKSENEAAVAASAGENATEAARNIEDYGNNTTRFLLVSKECLTEGRRASVIFGAENRPGGLLDMLELLAHAGVNMTRIQSRPSKTGLGDYRFFADFTLPDSRGNEALACVTDSLKKAAAYFKFLGRYDDIFMEA